MLCIYYKYHPIKCGISMNIVAIISSDMVCAARVLNQTLLLYDDIFDDIDDYHVEGPFC